jgi:pSer/pThr/pTyr-binding forkhead associated (FHA) protein
MQQTVAPIAKAPVTARLIQKRTGQTYPVEKPIYQIGKSGCDCNITDNPVVSRIHAQIIRREECFFVTDMFSTNKTFVNGRQIPAKQETALPFDSIICFGNEEFEFRK